MAYKTFTCVLFLWLLAKEVSSGFPCAPRRENSIKIVSPKLTFPSRESVLVPCDCCNNRLGGFKQHTYVLPPSGDQKSEVSFTGLKSRCLHGNVPPEALELDSLPCFFHFWRLSSFLISWPFIASPFLPLLPWPHCFFL